jgi:hypothetical protein
MPPQAERGSKPGAVSRFATSSAEEREHLVFKTRAERARIQYEQRSEDPFTKIARRSRSAR